MNKMKPNFRVFVITYVWCPPMVASSTTSHHQTKASSARTTTPIAPHQLRLPVNAKINPGKKQPKPIALIALQGLGPGT